MLEIVAEVSCNHAGSLINALALIQGANDAGCDAVKFQTFEPDGIARDMTIPFGLWEGQTLSQLYRDAYTPWEWLPTLFEHARALNLNAFSSVFSLKALDYLEKIGCPRYKVASFEITHLELLDAVAQTGKPVVLSTGMASKEELAEAVVKFKAGNLTLLHCVSGYPTPLDEMNLWRIQALENLFRVRVGFSDHVASLFSGAYAVAAGAQMLEKHLALPGVRSLDEAFSLTPFEMNSYVSFAHEAWSALQLTEAKSEAVSLEVKKARRAAHDPRPDKAA